MIQFKVEEYTKDKQTNTEQWVFSFVFEALLKTKQQR